MPANVRSFLITVELLTEAKAVNILVPVFRKDDYAVKYAVELLADGDAMLGDLRQCSGNLSMALAYSRNRI